MRILILGLLVVGLVGFVSTHTTFAGNEAKVDICHVNSSNSPGVYAYDYERTYKYTYDNGTVYDYGYTSGYSNTYHLGRVISVAESAVEAHVAHGDSTTFNDLTESTEDYITSLEDLNYNYSYYYSYDYGSYLYEYGYSYGLDNTNAVVRNANCYWTAYEYHSETN